MKRTSITLLAVLLLLAPPLCAGAEKRSSSIRQNLPTAVQSALRNDALGLLHQQSRRLKGRFRSSAGLEHAVITMLPFRYRQQTGELLIASSKPRKDFDYHTAAPLLSFFLYVPQRSGWVRALTDIGAFKMGSWGNAPYPDSFKTLSLMKNGDEALVLDDGGGGQGYWENYRWIYLPLDGKMREIFHEQTSLSDGGANTQPRDNWESDFTLLDDNGSRYKIIRLHRHGLRDAQRFDETFVYRFNGKKYVRLSARKVSATSGKLPPSQPNPLLFDEDGVRFSAAYTPAPCVGEPFTLTLQLQNRNPFPTRATLTLTFPQIVTMSPVIRQNNYEELKAYAKGNRLPDENGKTVTLPSYLILAKSPLLGPSQSRTLQLSFPTPRGLKELRILLSAELAPMDPHSPHRYTAPSIEMRQDPLGRSAAELRIPIR